MEFSNFTTKDIAGNLIHAPKQEMERCLMINRRDFVKLGVLTGSAWMAGETMAATAGFHAGFNVVEAGVA